MKKNLPLLIPVLPYLIMTSLIFFILPTMDANSKFFTSIMLLIIPTYCFISAFIYGLKNGNVWLYPIFMGFIFFPPIFLIVEIKALIYGGIYGAVALLGMYLGSLLKKRKTNDANKE